ncbi:hypothetical protein OPV22_021048 [Ensete ventricosum]|uniref:Uncharacterized protein n=1 Tax=Ensete ventricosum TaxID=4639 RepID=A0AAV8PAI0_ENSVE|nr:hypothetical protein OPV22_021048 [Ensete ventricosum]
MVGYTEPCPHCGCKRRRPSLDRLFTWPIDRSSIPAPAAKLARTNSGSIDHSSPTAANDPATDTAVVNPPTISFGAGRVPEPNESDAGTPSPRQQSPFAPSISIVPPTASGPLAPLEATVPDLPRSPAGERKSKNKKKEEEEV